MDDTLSPQTQDHLKRILDNSQWLLQIINDILDISKIESGKMELETVPFDLRELLSHCQTVVTPKALEKNIALHFESEPLIRKRLIGDPTRLRQVLVNILSNAIKFTHVGSVKVSAAAVEMSETSCTVRFEIRDSGIGITPGQLEKIFIPFVQADSSTTRKYGGTGLGLPITKNIIELMGGVLSVESAPGIGSKFSFTLTFRMGEDHSVADSRPLESGTVQKPVFSGNTAILVCEDNEMNQRVIREHLKRVGLHAEIAENGKIGVEKVKARKNTGQKPFDLIFMDMHMPVMDGLEASYRILQMNIGTPIIALTANVMSNDRELYIESGMNDCMGKPFTSQELWSCLLRYLKPVNEAAGKDDESAFDHELKIDFAKANLHKADEIKNAVAANDITLAHRLAHTLKSNAAIIGAHGLKAAAAETEALLSGGENRVKPEVMERLSFELGAVLNQLAPLLEPVSRSSQDTPKLNPKEALDLLNKLQPLLTSGNPECLEYTGALRGIEGSDELIGLMENFDFRPAAKILDGLIQIMEGQ
jgi:CheY-like chemotaxis protein